LVFLEGGRFFFFLCHLVREVMRVEVRLRQLQRQRHGAHDSSAKLLLRCEALVEP
jgi:hypothetical protein